MQEYEVDVLVIGSGVAGLVLAKLVAPQARVAVVTKKEESESSTNYAQGGIAAVLSAEDSYESHITDTLEAGAGLCDEAAVKTMVHEGPQLVRQLVDWGASFNLTGDNHGLDLGIEGGHTHRRIVHAVDQTGREVERALIASLNQEQGATLFEHHQAVQLLVGEGAEGRRCCGAVVLNCRTGECSRFAARATVLATGGVGRVYLHTTNPPIATGDGVAMAYRVGARVANLEFVQFHPTTFYAPQAAESLLISEAVRGEGAVLRRLDGSTFMEDYDPRGCLAPRDIVARAIDREMKNNGEPHLYLDMTMLDTDFIRQRFPYITQRCIDQGVDPTHDWVPIVPAAHYACGGVMVDTHGQSNIPGLYASGETACTGIHGANRLASNSLLEALVWSRRSAGHILEQLPKIQHCAATPDFPVSRSPERNLERVRIANCRDVVRRIMWDYVGIVRSDDRLRLAARRLEVVKSEVDDYIRQGYLAPALLDVYNSTEVATLIIRCAMLRKESRGLHYNIDHPDRDDVNWRQPTVLQARYPGRTAV